MRRGGKEFKIRSSKAVKDMIQLFQYQRLKTFISSKGAFSIALLWGFAEATFFFVVPDMFFCFTALLSPVIGFTHGLVSMFGTILGGFLMYHLAILNPDMMHRFLLSIPGIPEGMIKEVYANLQEDGLKALLIAPMKGIPYKIFAVEAGIMQIDLTKFFLMTLPSRLQRIFFLCLVVGVVSRIFRKPIERYTQRWCLFYVLFWISFYCVYAYYVMTKY